MKCREIRRGLIAGETGAGEREHIEQCAECSGFESLIEDMEEAGRKLNSVDMSEFAVARTRREVASLIEERKEEAVALSKEPLFRISFARIYAAAAIVLLAAGLFFAAGPLLEEGGDGATGAVGVQSADVALLNRKIDELRGKIDRDIASLSGRFEEDERGYMERARDELEAQMAMAKFALMN